MIKARMLAGGKKVYDVKVSLVVREGDVRARKQIMKRGFATQRAAKDWLNETVGAVKNDVWVKPSKDSFADYLDRWVEERPKLKARSRSGYRQHIDGYIRPASLGKIELRNVSTQALRAFFTALTCQTHADRPHRCAAGKVSPATARRVYSTVHAALETAVEDNLITRNPATKKLRKSLAEEVAPDYDPWTVKESQGFLEAVKGDPLFALWRLALATGMRRSELLGLRWADVDWTKGEIRVRQTLNWTKAPADAIAEFLEDPTTREDPRAVFGPPKSKKSRREIALGETTLAALKSHETRQAWQREALGEAWRGGDRDLVFVRPDGYLWHPDTIGERFQALTKAAGLRVIRFHDVRHGAVSIAAANGEAISTVSARLGHSSIAFTWSRYGHLFSDDNKKAGERMDEALDRKAVS